jgi:hypothetical protein
MTENIWWYVALCSGSIGIVALLCALTFRSLRSLLDEVIKLPSGTVFYLRMLFLILLLNVLSVVVNHQFDMKPEAAFMEYVWAAADALSSIFNYTSLLLLGYLVLITVLVALLRYKHD